MKQLVILLTALAATASAYGITPQSVDKTVAKLSLEQKARLLVGVGGCNSDISHYTPGAAGWTYEIAELGIPSINLADGPVGLRINPLPWQESVVTYDENGIPVASAFNNETTAGDAPSYATAFPSTTALAATWNRDMARLQGETMGDEARAYGVDVILSPGVNIMRNPLCGRNFEYYSEDPLLTGVLASELIKGIQSRGIGTSLKHFIANNQQTGKKVNDARMTQRALREIYARPFEIVVRDAKPWTVMGSYNYISGEPTQTNRELMTTLLRDEWGFDGLALTDWTVWRPADGLINARCPLIMPGNEDRVQEIIEAVKSGKVSEKQLDACVSDVLNLVAKSITAKGWTKTAPDLAVHAAASREVAGESMVLLKNNNSTLPLAPGTKIALFGTTAYKSIAGGTGSSNVNKAHIVDIDRGLTDAGYVINPQLAEVYRHYIAAQEAVLDNVTNCPDWMKISYHRSVIPEMNIDGATALVNRQAADNQAAVVVIGRKSGETSDRGLDGDYNLSYAEKQMIRRVCDAFHAVGKPVIVVLNVCGAMEVASWSELPDAILLAWFPGQECGDAVADVISGRVNPSGRLPMTLPVAYDHNPSSRNYPWLGQQGGRNFDFTEYQEDIWVGYRYFDACGLAPAYPFGYGLSYTTFDYSDATARRHGDRTDLSVTVTNTGDRAGKEVVALYVSAPESKTMLKPVAELRGFEKTRLLQPGESQRVTISVSDNDLASFDDSASAWVTDAGTYTAHLGGHPGDYRTETTFRLNKSKTRKVNNILAPVEPVNTINPFEEHKQKFTWHDASQFEILGRVYPDSLPIYARIPAFRKDVTRYEVYQLGQHSAGISIRFRSNSPTIVLKWNTVFNNTMTHMADLGTRGLDLYYLTDEGTWRYLGPGRPMGNPTYWTAAANMKPVMREYMIHLSLYDQVDKLEIGIDEGSVIERPQVASPRRGKPVVIYGTSLAHGATASRPGMAASNILQRELDCEFINLGFSANGKLDYEIAEMMAEVDAAAYIMDNIPNSSVDQIYNKTEKFVKILRDRHPDTPIIFVEDPKFPAIPLDKKMTETVGLKNKAIREVYQRMVANGLDNTYYVEQVNLQPEDGDATSDEYHYTDIGFRKYCDTLLPILKKILNK
ncbi:MAG: glycoside hydrolase family 3 C-terminal domain-containing protein [Muribaculaceae bacterium]|nr:glycoside hydrolase family 3 C-terminal domain-containing protein [Muribaculaceae bacterium]